MHRYRTRLQETHRLMVYVPLVLPDILMGMSLLLLFITAGLSLSLITITIAHITFCLSYVTLVVLARLQDFDKNIVEAARDLGATRFQAFTKVTLPLLLPGILAGGLLAFTLSIDDYVITFFVKGPGADTLPTLVYSMIKKSRELPVINALSTLMLLLTFIAVTISQRLTRQSSLKRRHFIQSTSAALATTAASRSLLEIRFIARRNPHHLHLGGLPQRRRQVLVRGKAITANSSSTPSIPTNR